MTKITNDSNNALDGKVFGKDMIYKGLKELEMVISSTSGTYCVGNEVTAADTFLIPQLYNARRYNIEVNEFPTITAIEKRLNELAAVKSADALVQPDAVV